MLVVHVDVTEGESPFASPAILTGMSDDDDDDDDDDDADDDDDDDDDAVAFFVYPGRAVAHRGKSRA